MQHLHMGHKLLDDLYTSKSINLRELETQIKIGQITDREKFKAAKQILLGLAILYLFTIIAYLYKPKDGRQLLEIITITFPPLTTLILAAYFRDKPN